MTSDANKDYVSADKMADVLLEAIENSTPDEVRDILRERYGSADEAVVRARSAVREAAREIALGRRRGIERQLAEARSKPSQDVSGLDRTALQAILEQHVANDAHAAPLTLAARNGSGDLSDDELRSVVMNILHLRAND